MTEAYQPQSHQERRESLYQRIDTQVQASKALFDGLYDLPVISLSNDEKAEEQQLNTLFQDTLARFPEETRKRYERFTYLSNQPRDVREKEADWLELERDTDVGFLQNCEFVIRGTQIDRGVARSMLGMISRKEQTVEEILSQLYNINLQGKAIQVIPGRFSIHVVLDNETYTAYRKSIQAGDSFGLHLSGSIWNFINDKSEIYQEAARRPGLPSSSYAFRQEVLEHEDAHALLESYLFPQEELGPTYAVVIRLALQFGIQRRSLTTARLAKNERRAQAIVREILSNETTLRSVLREIEDHNLDELLAEWISAPTRVIPLLTYPNDITRSAGALLPYTGSHPEILRTYQKLVNLDERLKSFHTEVENRAPGHVRDLRFALAIIPPSQWRHIHSLIQYWSRNEAI